MMNETTMYERTYRFFHRNIVKAEYQVRWTRLACFMMKHAKSVYQREITIPPDRIIQRIDLDDADEIAYMLRTTLNHPGMRCYLVYSNGARRRIKCGMFRGG